MIKIFLSTLFLLTSARQNALNHWNESNGAISTTKENTKAIKTTKWNTTRVLPTDSIEREDPPPQKSKEKLSPGDLIAIIGGGVASICTVVVVAKCCCCYTEECICCGHNDQGHFSCWRLKNSVVSAASFSTLLNKFDNKNQTQQKQIEYHHNPSLFINERNGLQMDTSGPHIEEMD